MKSATSFDWETVLDRLSAFYGTGDWRVPYLRDHAEDPFQVLIGTILSQRTRDANTDRASALLFARYPTAERLARAPLPSIERLIRSTGFYHVKARVIRACARTLLAQYGGRVPSTLEELVALPGVGPKTANCVLVFGYGVPAMPVDTHVHRIANRFAVVKTRTPEATELALRATVPREFWIPINPLLVQHGQNLCRPRNPLCSRCPLEELCPTGVARRLGRPTPRPEDRLPPAKPGRGSNSAPARRSVPAGPLSPPSILVSAPVGRAGHGSK
ncbi:MAG: endonuclease III [Thermoplasmata archaeon]|nr:endonuclease III [Thermoplasmata archaeon]